MEETNVVRTKPNDVASNMLLVRRFYPKRLTYSILWAIPTGAIWGEVSCPGTPFFNRVFV